MEKICVKIAGILNLITAFLHLLAGQLDLVNPLINSNLGVQQKAEWVSVWHMVTILLCFTSYIILRAGFVEVEGQKLKLLKEIGILYILIGIPFIISSIYYSVFAPQWILLMLTGFLLLVALKKTDRNVK